MKAAEEVKVRSGGNYDDGFLVIPIKRQQFTFDGDSPDMDLLL